MSETDDNPASSPRPFVLVDDINPVALAVKDMLNASVEVFEPDNEEEGSLSAEKIEQRDMLESKWAFLSNDFVTICRHRYVRLLYPLLLWLWLAITWNVFCIPWR